MEMQTTILGEAEEPPTFELEEQPLPTALLWQVVEAVAVVGLRRFAEEQPTATTEPRDVTRMVKEVKEERKSRVALGELPGQERLQVVRRVL
jgi:hypothetical protein